MGCSACRAKAKAMAAGVSGSLRQPPPGFSEANAILIGEPNETNQRVRVNRDTLGLSASSLKWVTGTGVQALIDDNSFTATVAAPSARSWKVGEFSYFDYALAQEASAASGNPIVEVS